MSDPTASPLGLTLPTFLIIGAPKSGTTTLWHYLRSHPDVFVPPMKEIDFFTNHGPFGRGVEWYASLFAAGKGYKAIGEASPSYLFSREAKPRMARIVPDAQLIAILRNPIDRAYSHYLHARYYALERRSFRDAVRDELRAPDGQLFPYYLAMSRYLPQLEELTEHFDREKLLVLLLDDLVQDRAAVFRALCRHIGVDEHAVPREDAYVTNTYREARMLPLWRILARPKVSRTIERISPRGWSGIRHLFTREGRSPPELEPGVRQELADYFASDNAALGDWLQRDLSFWK